MFRLATSTLQLRAIFILALLMPSICLADDKLEAAQEQAQAMQEALVDGEYDKFIELNYPPLIAKFGGKDKMKEIVVTSTSTMKGAGMTLDSVSVEEPEKIYSKGARIFTIVPMTMEFSIKNDKKLTAKGSLLGFSDDQGKKWWFLDTAKGKTALIQELLPELPADLEFPKMEEPKIE